MTDKDQAINDCLNKFRWDRVHRVMTELDWGWARYEMQVPTVYQMMKSARRLLETAWDGHFTVESGGFRATYFPAEEIEGIMEAPGLSLAFIVESTVSD